MQEGAAAVADGPQEEAPKLALGQRVLLHDPGVRQESLAGVVVGWDRSCCEGAAWKERCGVEKLSQVPPPPCPVCNPVPSASAMARWSGSGSGYLRVTRAR